MCRGTNEKMLILSEMIVVGWRTIGGHDDWPEFQAAEWWHKACAVMTENDPCVWYSLCPRYAIMYEKRILYIAFQKYRRNLSSANGDSTLIIGPESDHCHSLTHWLTHSLLTLACEDANSKLVEVVTFADVDA